MATIFITQKGGERSISLNIGILFLMVFPLLVHFSISFAHRYKKSSLVVLGLCYADSIIIGVAIPLLEFNLLPCLVLVTMAIINVVASASPKHVFANLATFLASCITSTFIMGFNPIDSSNIPYSINIISILSVAAFMLISTYYSHAQSRSLSSAQKTLIAQQDQYRELSRKMAKYLPPQVWGSLFAGKQEAKVESKRKKLTVFFSDIKGFSSLSEQMPLDELTELLNNYLDEMTKIALRHGGTIDKFIGDAIMIFFGDPSTEGTEKDAQACVSMAIEMQQHMKLLQQKWRRKGSKHIFEIRIGINTGFCTVGNFGAESRMDYTILGNDVNVASRLESNAPTGGILISEATHELISDRISCRDKGEITVKGIQKPVSIYEVVDFKHNLGSTKNFVSLETYGFSIHMDTHKIKSHEKETILTTLKKACIAIKKVSPITLDTEEQGLALFLDVDATKETERQKIYEVLARCGKQIKQK